MRYTDIIRKETPKWPWLAGLAVLVLVIWGVTALLGAPAEEEAPVVAPAAEDTLRPVAIPQAPQPPGAVSAASIAEAVALDEARVGEAARLEGEVVATGTTGFWMRVGTSVVRVDSEREARKGEYVIVEGTIRPADGERTDQIAADVLSRIPRSNGWEVVRAVKLVDGDG
jgi:hypothetical protein